MSGIYLDITTIHGVWGTDIRHNISTKASGKLSYLTRYQLIKHMVRLCFQDSTYISFEYNFSRHTNYGAYYWMIEGAYQFLYSLDVQYSKRYAVPGKYRIPHSPLHHH